MQMLKHGLIAYSTDITKLNSKEIENMIKRINRSSLQNKRLQKYTDNTGYRNKNVEITGKDVELLDKSYVEQAMKRLSEDIYNLVSNVENMNEEEYLQKAAALQYRFLRIHPFPDSNGRTSRFLLNMITIPKGVMINFPKETKKEYTKLLNEKHNEVDKKGYLKALEENSDDLEKIELETNTLIDEYISNNSISVKEMNKNERDLTSKENSVEKYLEKD